MKDIFKTPSRRFNQHKCLLSLNNYNSDPDINFFNSKFDVADSPYFSLEEIPCKAEKFTETHFLSFMSILEAETKIFRNCLNF